MSKDGLEYRLFKLYERAYQTAAFIKTRRAPHWLSHEERTAFALAVVGAVGRTLVEPADMARREQV